MASDEHADHQRCCAVAGGRRSAVLSGSGVEGDTCLSTSSVGARLVDRDVGIVDEVDADGCKCEK